MPALFRRSSIPVLIAPFASCTWRMSRWETYTESVREKTRVPSFSPSRAAREEQPFRLSGCTSLPSLVTSP